MGMTIDEAQEILSRPLYMKNVPQEIIDAHRVTISTMRKYQKIEDIYYHQTGRALEDSLKEVIEDGDNGKSNICKH